MKDNTRSYIGAVFIGISLALNIIAIITLVDTVITKFCRI